MLLRVLLYIKRDTDKRPNTLDLGGCLSRVHKCQAEMTVVIPEASAILI
jgi:hypothetical protein